MSSDRAQTVAVLGGGIAGLAAAYSLRRQRPDLEVTVYEGSSVVGGKLRVSELAGLPVDEGAEAMLNRRPEAVALTHAAGLTDDLVHPQTLSSGVWTRGAVRPLPPTVMGIPTDLKALVRSGIVHPSTLARVQADRVLPASAAAATGADVSVGALVGQRLGREVRDRLVEPLLGGVYAGHADQLSLRAGVPQIAALVDRDRSLLAAAAEQAERGRGNRVPVFAGIRGGIGRLPPAVAEASGAVIRTGAMVRGLARTEHGWRVLLGPTREETTVEVDGVVVALPASPASRLIRDAVPAGAARLAEIEYASVALAAFAFRREAVADRLPGSGFLVPPVDGRTIKAATFSSHKWSWLADADPDLVVVRTSLGRHREERDLQRDDVDLAAVALADLHRATGMDATPVATRVTRWGGALPQYAVGHADRVATVRAAVAGVPALAVCGAAYDGVGIPACVASAEKAVTQVLAGLDGRETIRS
ncbi:MAG TPA: protoporphyrinogen oxidase [Nocardioidaceae bacterium]|nr:protoporphyrinogen oxidase [Nocardioidaceae bacterium]